MATRLIVLTGGPGAGKTAVLELARRKLPPSVAILPEAASLVFSGGFWRLPSVSARAAAQRAIFHVQSELERMVLAEAQWGIGICDRGTLDGLAYWPISENFFWEDLGTSREREFAKYDAVIHLRTPTIALGYNHQNPIRTESAVEAARIDERIARVWEGHPGYTQIPSTSDFMEKARVCLEKIEELLRRL